MHASELLSEVDDFQRRGRRSFSTKSVANKVDLAAKLGNDY
jgi:hypothetical protein